MPASLSRYTGYNGGYWKIRNVRQEVQPLHCWTQSPYFLQSPHPPIQTYGPLLQCRSLSASSVWMRRFSCRDVRRSSHHQLFTLISKLQNDLISFHRHLFIKRSHADNFLSVCQLSGSKSQPVSDIVFIYRMQIERISYIDCHSHCRVGQIQGFNCPSRTQRQPFPSTDGSGSTGSKLGRRSLR